MRLLANHTRRRLPMPVPDGEGGNALFYADFAPALTLYGSGDDDQRNDPVAIALNAMGIYNRSDRRRWYWQCPHCASWFEAAPGLSLFKLPSEDQLIEDARTIDIDAFAYEPGLGVYFSIDSPAPILAQIACVPGWSVIQDGDLFAIPAYAITFSWNQLVVGVWPISAHRVKTEADFDAMLANSQIGDRNGFKTTDSLKAIAAGKWDYATLEDYLEDPKRLAPKGSMSFAGLKKPEDRAAVIKYLMSTTENPPPLPAGQ